MSCVLSFGFAISYMTTPYHRYGTVTSLFMHFHLGALAYVLILTSRTYIAVDIINHHFFAKRGSYGLQNYKMQNYIDYACYSQI